MPTSFASQSEKQAMCLDFFVEPQFQLSLGHFTIFLFHAFAMSHMKSHPGPPQEVCRIMIPYLNLSLFQPYFQVESHECFTPLSQWLSSRESTRHCALPYLKKNTGVSELTFKTFYLHVNQATLAHGLCMSLPNFQHQTKPSHHPFICVMYF